jgi:hypothetical protein
MHQRALISTDVDARRRLAQVSSDAAFASGFGDGAYPSYAGFDGDGQVVVVLTDFGILDAPKD